MILGGYGIEILVNDDPLREYSEPYENSKMQITTKQSYIQGINADKRYESDRTVFVAVPKPGMKFTVKIWADSANSKKAYRIHVYIDGIWDHASYTLTDSRSNIIEHFIDEKDKKKYNFIFAQSMWSDDVSKEVDVKENNNGRFGSISVEFFEATWSLKEYARPSYTVKQAVVTESKNYTGLSFSTRFEEAPIDENEELVPSHVGGSYYGWKSADKPSAVLTLHYRPKTWLEYKGLTPDPFYSRLTPELEPEVDLDEYGRDRKINYDSEEEIERERARVRKKSRVHKYIDFDDGIKRRKVGVDEVIESQIVPEKVVLPKLSENNNRPSLNNHHKISVNNNRSSVNRNNNNKPIGKSILKKVDKSVPDASTVKFARYYEEIVEETKFIDIEVDSSNPIEEIRQNKKLREIIEILDSDEEA
ncbi:8493_t:CDS:2 [Funneliformis geosporum]|uniref:8479_t:CDS:1 n=1 Tax=Funneliformis geosporum TaxID=1117311 RepID=A0A9W4SDG1_9GLOM|nr:8479_t:CDS:2 [Funneliformis geosporum]CAI2166643.1 8493_t:CDS:2 [Funneliformis geosporum]